MVAEITLFNRIVELLIDAPDPASVLQIKATPGENERVAYLLNKNKTGGLSLAEDKELDKYFVAEHIVRLAKSKALKKLRRA